MVELNLFLIDLLTYLIFAGTSYLIFYVILKNVMQNRIIQKKFENTDKIFHEIKYSISTIVIFTLNFVIVYQLQKRGYTRHYSDISEYGIWYLFGSVALMVLMHDTYFYFTHR